LKFKSYSDSKIETKLFVEEEDNPSSSLGCSYKKINMIGKLPWHEIIPLLLALKSVKKIFDIKIKTKCSIKKEESTNTYLNLQTLGKFLLQF
jgi:hypothetical protein